MERSQLIKKLQLYFNKYKFVILILLLGLVFMLFPTKKSQTEHTDTQSVSYKDQESLSQQLENVLSAVHGAGRVRVILTVAAGEEVIYQTNEDHTTNNDAVTQRGDTVVISDSNRNEQGLIKCKNAPIYRGALVVCDGAENPTVTLAVVEAVSNVTGLSSDKISVLKMQ